MAKKVLLILLAAACACVFVACAVMAVMAVRFGEWGRVLFYGILAFIGLEMGLLALFKLKKREDT